METRTNYNRANQKNNNRICVGASLDYNLHANGNPNPGIMANKR